MPRVFFTGRRKIARNAISVVFYPERPPRFTATLDLSRYRRSIPDNAKVVIYAYHNTALEKFDFGTVGDPAPRDSLRLTQFEPHDRPHFRLLIVGTDEDAGAVLGACDQITAVESDAEAAGGRSMLQMVAKPDSQMRGELWRLEEVGNRYQLWYNNDVPAVARGIKDARSLVSSLILPSAFREILGRYLFWRDGDASDGNEWLRFAESISGERVPQQDESDDGASQADLQEWVDGAVAAFCQSIGRFVSYLQSSEESRDEASSS